MKRIKTTVTGLTALVAMLVLGAFAAGVAQAHTFLLTGATSGLLLVSADGPQVFAAVSGGAAVTCTKVALDGSVTKESQLTVTAKGLYTGCTGPLTAPATVSEVEYELNADETVAVINKTISISIPLVPCTIKIAPAGNGSLSKIRYLADPNGAGRLLPHVEVGGITSTIEGGGGVCGTEGESKTGTYRGLVLALVDGSGSLTWS